MLLWAVNSNSTEFNSARKQNFTHCFAVILKKTVRIFVRIFPSRLRHTQCWQSLNPYRGTSLLLREGRQGCVKYGMQQGRAVACPGRSPVAISPWEWWQRPPGTAQRLLQEPTLHTGCSRRLILLPPPRWRAAPACLTQFFIPQIRYFSPVVLGGAVWKH